MAWFTVAVGVELREELTVGVRVGLGVALGVVLGVAVPLLLAELLPLREGAEENVEEATGRPEEELQPLVLAEAESAALLRAEEVL